MFKPGIDDEAPNGVGPTFLRGHVGMLEEGGV